MSLLKKRHDHTQQAVLSNDTTGNAKKYAASGFDNTYFLGFRDIPHLLEKYTCGNRALDYGCGTGRSSLFLRKNGFQVIGVDISSKMLRQAVQKDHSIHYLQMKNGKVPVFDESCDLVFSSFVLFTVPLKESILKIFKETYRCLTNEGVFIIITGSEDLYSHEWLSYYTDFPQNKNLKSGDETKIKLKDLDIEFLNYYWTDKDYEELFDLSGFSLLEKRFPYGQSNEGKNWISETRYSPYVIYVLNKR